MPQNPSYPGAKHGNATKRHRIISYWRSVCAGIYAAMAAARFSSDVLQTSSCQVFKFIQNLPPELREIILKKYIEIKIKEKKEIGWDEVHYDIGEAPFCKKRSRIVKIMFCTKCNLSCVNGLCYECYKNGVKHYLGYPIYDENDYNEIFQKFY